MQIVAIEKGVDIAMVRLDVVDLGRGLVQIVNGETDLTEGLALELLFAEPSPAARIVESMPFGVLGAECGATLLAVEALVYIAKAATHKPMATAPTTDR